MIETPSLRTRLTVVTVALVAVAVVALELVVYLSLRDELDEALEEVLATRATLVAQLADDAADPAVLASELAEQGVPAVLTTPDGTVLQSDPAARRFDVVPPGTAPDAGVERLQLTLPDGTMVEVLVSRAGVDATLQQVLLAELGGTAVVVLLLAFALRRAAGVATRPLDRMVEVASHIAGGDRSRRLRPTDPTTELGRLAAAFDDTFDALEDAIDQAERAELRSRRFLADAAHQLRTPLAGLRASAETLLAHPDDGSRERLAGNVAREAARLSRLVDRLLRVARIDRGEAINVTPTDLAVLCEDELDRQRALAPSLALSVVERDDPPVVRCDSPLVREALANLLDNARRHAAGSVVVEVAGVVGVVELRVRDDGPGLSPALEEEAFDRFSSTSGGSGLGLPIARGIAEAHGGDLRWDDGAFVLTLPVEPLTAAAASRRPTSDRPGDAASTPGPPSDVAPDHDGGPGSVGT